MIPNIFVSSTIEDLHHLRDAIRDAILELAYNPVMSEYGDIGYLPSASAEESCYLSMRQCQLAIIIVGKRYGSLSANNFSISHNEFQTARDQKIPVICLVDQEVWAYKRVFDANKPKKSIALPGMDAPDKTFAFLQSIIESPHNNGILPFTNVTSARNHLKTQLAHLFGDLLTKRFDPIKADVMDVLSEIKTLRHELKGGTDKESLTFMKAIRFTLEDRNDSYRSLIEQLYETVDQAIPDLIASRSFKEFVQRATGSKLGVVKLKDGKTVAEFVSARLTGFRYTIHTSSRPAEDRSKFFWVGITGQNQVFATPHAVRHLESRHDALQETILVKA